MRRALPAVAALVAMLLLPAAATAKGPSAASISGPGLDHAISIQGYGEGDSSSPLGILVEQSGFFAQVFEQTPSPTSSRRPTSQLGPRYDVTYTVPGGPNGDSILHQDLYPYAANGPVSYVAPNQTFWASQKTAGGWFRGDIQLKRMLVKAGMPARAPSQSATHGGKLGVALGAGAGVAVAAAGLALLYRRRSASG
ncbi:MAG: hypothetical protein H0W90_15335 [Actinobacteria bacterium]|nr:hypothetical protein [Actinomycetota bacterium]